MNMKMIFAAAGAAMSLSAVAARSTEIGFRFEADHPDCLYRLGEECVLTVTATNGAGEAVKDWHCSVEIDNYGGTVYEVIKEVDFAKTNPFVLKAKPSKPGFVRFRMRGSDRKGDYLSGLWAVGFDPEKLRPASERPADFEEFWRAAIAKFEREVPIDAKMELNEKESNATHDCYELTFATVPKGRVIRGQLSIPKKEGRFPVLMNVPGAGSGSWGWSKLNDCCYLTLNVLDYPRRPNREVKDDVAGLYKEQNVRWSMKSGLDKDPWYFVGDLSKNREDFFYYGAILGINRAVDWVAKLPRIDTSSFRYEGQSQGGAFGIILSALNRNLTRAQIGEPAITDISGYLADKRQSGWPLLPERLNGNKALQTNALKIAPYFDCAHFVPMITIPTRWNVGFIDELCPPHAVYAGYNCLRSKDHRLLNFPGLGHGTPPKKYWQAVQATVKSWEDPAAEFRDYKVQEAGKVSRMEVFDNPLFEKPDVPGVKSGDTEKRQMPHCGYNGSGGLRIEPTPAGKGKKVQTRHNFVHRLGKLEKGHKYVWSIKTKLHGDSYCHVAWEGYNTGAHVKGNWSVRRKTDEGGWVHNEIDIVVPEDRDIDQNTLLVIVTRNATAEGEAWCDFDNLDFREDVPEWTLANTWPIHNQVYNDEGRVRFYTEFVGDFIPKGAEAAYLCEVVDDEGGTVSSAVCTPKDGVFTADFKPLAYTGKGKLRVSCMDRTHRVRAGVKEFAVDILPRPFEKKDVIYVDELGRMRMNGKFFMPLGFYSSFGRGNEFDDERFTREMDEFRKNGANLIVEYWPEKWERPGNRWYDIAYEHGVYVFRNYCSVWHHRTDGTLPTYFENARKMAKIPAVVGFYSFDELPTDWAQWYADFRRGLHEAAPDEVVWYSNIFNPAPFLISGDISGCGTYPVGVNKERGLPDSFTESVKGRIVPNSRVRSASWLPYGQSFNWSDYKEWKNDREQYIAKGEEFGYEDMMAEALLFFSYGARGMLYFGFSGIYAGPVPELYPKRHADCMRVMRELRALEKFVMGSKPIAEVPHRDLKGRTRVVKLTADDGEEIVFAISIEAGENECEFDFKGQKRHYRKGPIAAEIYR